MKRIILSLIIFAFIVTPVFAGGVAQRAEQIKAQRQQAIIQQQRQLQQQAIAQQQAAYQQALQQRAVQQRAMQQAVQQRAYQQAVQQKAVQQATQQRVLQQQALQQKAYQHAQQQSLLAQQQAYAIAARQQALQQQALQQAVVEQRMSQQQAVYEAQKRVMQQQTAVGMMAQKAVEEYKLKNAAQQGMYYDEKPAAVADIREVWEKLQSSSRAWSLIMDMEPKLSLIAKQISDFKNEGVKISKPPQHYVTMIDSISLQNPQMLNNPFKDVVKVMAIIEYDFENGTDKDALALKVLGSQQAVENNKKRLGIK